MVSYCQTFGVILVPLTPAAEKETRRAHLMLRCSRAPWPELRPLSCPSTQPILVSVRSGVSRERRGRSSVDPAAPTRGAGHLRCAVTGDGRLPAVWSWRTLEHGLLDQDDLCRLVAPC